MPYVTILFSVTNELQFGLIKAFFPDKPGKLAQRWHDSEYIGPM